MFAASGRDVAFHRRLELAAASSRQAGLLRSGPAWDEAGNCLLFHTREITERVQKRLAETAKAQGLERDICPANIKKCQEIVDYYKADPRVAKHLISPLCAMAVDFKIIDENDGLDFFSKHQKLYSFEEETRSCYGVACSLGQIGGLALEYILAKFGINHTIRCKYLNMP